MEDTIQKEVNSQNLYLLFKLRSLKVTKTIAGEAVFLNENMSKGVLFENEEQIIKLIKSNIILIEIFLLIDLDKNDIKRINKKNKNKFRSEKYQLINNNITEK